MSEKTSRETLAAIESHIVRDGVPPTVRELATTLRLSPSTVMDRLRELERAGRIERVGHRKLIKVRER